MCATFTGSQNAPNRNLLRATLGPFTPEVPLFDRQAPKDETELGEKLPELFDIHVMFFADTSSSVVGALERAFGLDRSAAEKLIAEAPVMVKRAASPEVADALLDLLNGLGAQVVLLPSTGVPSSVPADSDGSVLEGKAAPPATQEAASSEKRPSKKSGATTPRAKSADRVPVAHPTDSGPRQKPRSDSALPAASAPLPSVAPRPAAPVVTPLPAPVPMPQVQLGSDDHFHAARSSPPLELAAAEPTPRVYTGQLRALAEASEPMAKAPASPGGADPQVAMQGADLGLGSVPPLPLAASPTQGQSLPPPRLQAPPPPAAARAGRQRPAAAPPEDTRAPRERVPSGSRMPAQMVVADDPGGFDFGGAQTSTADPFWANKRRNAITSSDANATSGDKAAVPVRPSMPAPEREARVRSIELPIEPQQERGKARPIALVLGVGILFVAFQLGHSIFTGSADFVWVSIQALALFALGFGVTRKPK